MTVPDAGQPAYTTGTETAVLDRLRAEVDVHLPNSHHPAEHGWVLGLLTAIEIVKGTSHAP